MADTTIRVSNETKERLAMLKREGESFEDVIVRLTADEKWTGFGALSDADGDPREGMERMRREMRDGVANDLEDQGS
ncbi:antitoxin VapB family protein [Halostella salina]|uniref:antitoxin VapB family protein n=1 Tax=Halostella salina TaxID=1547897 RepID=UPI000EF79BC0|nr:antitoxin VapB family protein [Halostella salina]